MRLYQEELMDHYQHPRHKGVLNDPDFYAESDNPSCGDAVSVQGKIKNGILTAVAFQGKGCVISQASASMVCDYALDKSLDELLQLIADDIITLIKIPLGPTRLKCALLILYALKNGIIAYKRRA